MTANLRDGYREGVWAAVPEGAAPPDLELRRAFLLGRLGLLAGAGERPLRVLDVGCGEAHLTAASQITSRLGTSREQVLCLFSRTELNHEMHRLDEAIDLYGEALEVARQIAPELRLVKNQAPCASSSAAVEGSAIVPASSPGPDA